MFDLIVDDASHLYRPTLASFEVLYPRLRPGGTYVIEDWAGDHHIASQMARSVEGPEDTRSAEVDRIAAAALGQITTEAREAGLIDAFKENPGERVADVCRAVIEGQDRVPLSRLGLELVLAQAEMPGIYESIEITDGWLVIERGDADLDPDNFRVRSTWRDYYQLLDPLDYATLDRGASDGTS